MEKIIKQYECGQELTKEDLNNIINQGNSIILYIEDHENEWSRSGEGNNVQITPIGNSGLRIAKYKIDNDPEGYIYAPTTTPGLNGDVTIIEPVDFTGSKVHIANYTAGNGSGKLYAPAPGSGGSGNGQNGLDGLSTLFAFKGFANDSDAKSDWNNNFKNSRNYPPGNVSDGWSTSSNVSLQTGHMLYMTTAQRLGNNYITVDGAIWLKPVRIGSDGSTSTTGTDEDDYNYIYSRTTVNVAPYLTGTTGQSSYGVELLNSIENNDKKYGFKPDDINNSIDIATATIDKIDGAWTDHPYGVSSQLPFEWQTGFKKNATSGNWEYYFGPVIISHYGHDGLDGDGLEYIFYLLAKNLAGIPSLGEPYKGRVGENSNVIYEGVYITGNNTKYQEDDFIPVYNLNDKWHDNPQTISEEYPRQYVSTRKKDGSLEAGNLWQAFTTPKLWNVYATNGFLATLDNDTIIFDDDTDHDAIEYVSLTKEFLWDGANDVTLSNNYTSVTVTINCVGFSSELRPGIASIDSNGDVSVGSGTDWGTPMEINRSNYTGFALTKREGVGKLETKTGSITYTIRAYQGETMVVEASRIQTIQVIDINNGVAYLLLVTPNTLGVERTSDSSPYAFRGNSSIVVTATAATETSVEGIEIKNGSTNATNVNNGDLYVVVSNSGGAPLGIAPTVSNNNKTLTYDLSSLLNLNLVTTIAYVTVDLYYMYNDTGIKVDSETVDFSIKGDKGQDGSGTESYVVTSLNDNAVIDDLTVDENALKAATLNTLTVYKGNTNVTNECRFVPENVNLPSGLNLGIISNGSTSYLSNENYNNNLINTFVLYASNGIINFNPGNYYYDINIIHDNLSRGIKRFKLYIDSNISSDGSFYKLSITNDTISYSSNGTPQSTENIVIKAYKILSDGTSSLLEIVSCDYGPTMSGGLSGQLLVLFDDYELYRNASSTSEGEIIIPMSSILYSANGYDVTLYNGSSYVDGPEHIDCVKDGAPGSDGQDSVVYNLEPYPTVLKFNVAPDGVTLTPPSLVARCNISKVIGNTSTIYDSTIDGYCMYYNITLSDGTITNISNSNYIYVNYSNSSGSSGIAVSNLNTNYTSVNFYLAKSSSSDLLPGEIIKQVSIPILRDGLKGDSGDSSTGLIGKFYYFAGNWIAGNHLIVTAHLYPYVYYNGDYWMFIGEYNPNSETDNDTYKNPVDNWVVWEKITYNKFLISEAMFAKYAQLGALIVNRDWMISQYGTYNGSPSWSAYVNFDPIAFMTYLRPNEGASIGVIPRTNGSNLNLPSSLMFLIRLTADITVTVTGTTKLIEVSEYKSDNSLSINYENNQIKYGFENSGTATISNYNSNKWYCFVGGQVSDIKVKYSDVTSVFIPNYALDLRSGLTYLNNAYVKGEIHASSGSITGNMDVTGSLNIGGTSGGKFKICTDNNYWVSGKIIGYSSNNEELISLTLGSGGNDLLGLLTLKDTNAANSTVSPGYLFMSNTNSNTRIDHQAAIGNTTGHSILYLQESGSGNSKPEFSVVVQNGKVKLRAKDLATNTIALRSGSEGNSVIEVGEIFVGIVPFTVDGTGIKAYQLYIKRED